MHPAKYLLNISFQNIFHDLQYCTWVTCLLFLRSKLTVTSTKHKKEKQRIVDLLQLNPTNSFRPLLKNCTLMHRYLGFSRRCHSGRRASCGCGACGRTHGALWFKSIQYRYVDVRIVESSWEAFGTRKRIIQTCGLKLDNSKKLNPVVWHLVPRWHVSIQGQGWEEKEMFDDFPTAAVVRGSCPFWGGWNITQKGAWNLGFYHGFCSQPSFVGWCLRGGI